MGSFRLPEFTKEEIVIRFAITLFRPQSYFPNTDGCVRPSAYPSGDYEETKSHRPSIINI